ncbi:hypothetical protein AA309_26595 [Microvirga vignae]|uniref:Uncharacterized protein n=1 Tax=Microvirga vignae TaxID=1225564 RepID=A0A0H1RCJ4_9HYPH|nr:hypothetical protein [Microvirga vignae]KLK90302.1 hypothetical protein AA309_26595 [Microvirga vignae]
MSVRPTSDQLLKAAELVAGHHPDVAALLRDLAEPTTPPDPVGLRKRVLRRIWRIHLAGMPRTAAARVIAAAWASYEPTEAQPVPGTQAADFDRLSRAGVRPLAWRQIADALDEMLD